MTSDYYFKKWKKTLEKLRSLTELDIEYQTTKAHDQQLCEAAHRLNSILVNYIVIYNDASDCLQHNLQIQKTEYIYDVVKAVDARIIELKEQLRKLEGAYYQLLSNGLTEQKLTPYNVEFSSVTSKYERPENVKIMIKGAFEKAKEIKEESIQNSETILPETDALNEDFLQNIKWWEDNNEQKTEGPHGINMTAIYEIKEVISEETLERNKLISLIQAHERTRQVIKNNIQRNQKREIWEKELRGTLNPPSPLALRERSARLIQRVLKNYFEIKRNNIRNCKLDEKLNINLCNIPEYIDLENVQQDLKSKEKYTKLYKEYHNQWEQDCKKYKQNYLKRNHDDIAEHYRDYIRHWFQIWHEEVNYFYNIPKENEGGISLIIKEEVPTPSEWLEKYEAYIEMKMANKNKTAYQLKIERLAAKEEETAIKKEMLKQKKLEAELLKKIMKNPMLHPGYNYPMSKKTDHIIEAIALYAKNWKELDKEENLNIKEKYNKVVDQERICMEAKIGICEFVNDDMRVELNILKKALKEDYKNNEEQMPEEIKEKKRRSKKRGKFHVKLATEDTCEKLTELAIRGHLKDYPQTELEDFLGDMNYAGPDLRCDLQQALYFGGEFRALWWEMCRDALHGFRRILLVGPEQTGKTTLVHIMATVNGATLYEINPCQIEIENQNTEYLQQLVNAIADCAKITQPSIIYIKLVHKLYYSKVPPNEVFTKFDLIKRFFTRKLFKKFNKHDKITIIGSCIEPWTVKSKQMLKKFPHVLLLPDTNYSTVYLILRKWMLSNRIVPRDLNINSLAYLLQGYSFGYLKHSLEKFLTADRITRIAAFGLRPQDIYNYILEDNNESKIDYNKYIKWYTDNTHWGKLELKRLNEKMEFKMLVQKWEEKTKKRKRNK